MKEFINKYIKDLSIKDKKTLSQKTLKLVEEVGELAKVILPYDSASGTNHRFTDRESILEEIIDVYLTNISIAYSLNFTDDEINEMLENKSKKWAELQINEDDVTYPIPFEIHVTIDGKDINIENFKENCQSVGVKPIVIDLELNDDSIIKDVMTSSKYLGDNRTAYEESIRIVDAMKSFGYDVVRNKIETIPWHPAAPRFNTGYKIPNGCYFESHIGVSILPSDKAGLKEFVADLNRGCTKYGVIELGGTVKLSQNFFKKSKNGSKFINMLTYRNNMTNLDEFKREVQAIQTHLKSSHYEYEFEKVEVEYAIYDSNVTHDSKWLYENV